jgi:uncharacterized membrane-anchored protein
VVLAGLFVVLLVANYSIFEKERVLAEGRVVLLELAPVDPRSLMQGDYMALRFALQSVVAGAVADGYMVLGVDERGVGRFRRLDESGALASDEVRVFYRTRLGQMKFGTNAFFFQEGDADLYAGAKFGEFRIDGSGQILLTGLRDGEGKRLGR